MEERKREEEEVVAGNDEVTEAPVETKNTNQNNSTKNIIITVLVVVIITLVLIFVMEKQGRINTGLFSGVIENIEASKPAAKVNGATVLMTDFNSGVKQLAEMAKLQGVDTTSEEAMNQFRSQTIETLVNGEILRQTALEKGVKADNEDVEARFNEIQEGVGGAEALAAKMLEFGVTEQNLRRDIENEILIQGLFDQMFDINEIEVSEEEISDFYNQVGGVEAGLPPIDEVRDQITEQIRSDKQQQKIGEYIEELRGGAEIEILI